MAGQILATALDAANFALVVLGVAWAFRVVRFPDLSGEGTFVLGAFVSARLCCASFGCGAVIGLLAATLAGCAGGMACALLNSRLKIPNLLCGILVMLGLYSVNMAFLGKPNADVDPSTGVFAPAFLLGSVGRDAVVALALLGLFGIVLAALTLLLKSSSGLRLRAASSNPSAAKRFGISPELSQVAGLALANAIIAFAGGLFAQRSGFVAVTMGHGIVIHALAAILLGEALLRRRHRMFDIGMAALLGACVYKLIVAIALRLGLSPHYQNAITVLVVLLALGVFSKRVRDGLSRDVRV